MFKNNNIQNFLRGLGSVELFPETPSHPMNGKSDDEWLKSDWEAVGNDFYKGVEQLTNGRNSGK